MEWLLLLLCPLMMIFCMRGHGGKHQNHNHSHSHSHGSHAVSQDNLSSMDQYKMNELLGKVDLLTEQNIQLKEELEALKSEKNKNIVS